MVKYSHMKQTYSNQAGFVPVIIIVIAVVVGFFGGGAGLAIISDSAKPGEALFSVDVIAEKVQEMITFNAEAKADFRTEVVQERLQEIEEMLSEKGVEAPGLQNALSRINQAMTDLEAFLAAHPEFSLQFQESTDELSDRIESLKADHEELEDAFEDEDEDEDFEDEDGEDADDEDGDQEDEDNDDADENDDDDSVSGSTELRVKTQADITEVKADFTELQADAVRFNIVLPAEKVSAYQAAIIQAETAFANGQYAQVEAFVDRAEEAIDGMESPVEEARHNAGEVDND